VVQQVPEIDVGLQIYLQWGGFVPGSYLIDMPRRIVFTRAWGVLIDDEMIAHARALRADARFEPAFHQVIDFREVSMMKITTPGVLGVAQRNPFAPEARRALIVASDEAYGLARMYAAQIASGDNQIRIFRVFGPAMEWVGLDATAEWPADAPHATFG
jgi:hypothetical protein